MQQAIQFDTVIERGIIRIPEQYINEISDTVKVTLSPLNEPLVNRPTMLFWQVGL